MAAAGGDADRGAGFSRSFEDALSRDQGWRRSLAAMVIEEYRRFLYLAAISDREVTPSRAVDAAWHLHLTWGRHYWDELCGRILRRPLHHLPGDGSAADEERHRRQYLETLALYERVFGASPPHGIWPRPEAQARSPASSLDRRQAGCGGGGCGPVWGGDGAEAGAGSGCGGGCGS